MVYMDEMMQDACPGLLLAECFSKVSTPDMGAAVPLIERLHGPFVAHAGAQRPGGLVDIRAARVGQVALGTFSFGRTIEIAPNALDDAVVVATATRGRAEVLVGGVAVALDAGQTIVAHREDQPVFRYQPESEVLKVRLQRAALERAFARGGHAAPRARLRFETAMADAAAGMRWKLLLGYLVGTLNLSAARAPSAPELACLEELVASTLLGNQPHSWRAGPAGAGAGGGYLERALAYIERNLAQELTLADISDAACCSPRTLARAFAGAGAGAPMQYVHRLRLQRIRAELAGLGGLSTTVAEVALRCGCRHLGEFNRQYLAAFGETPSQTRRAARLLAVPAASGSGAGR